jgi:hypothetical protein
MEKVNIGGWWDLADLGGSVQGQARGFFKTVSVARPNQGPPSTEVSVYRPPQKVNRRDSSAPSGNAVASPAKRIALLGGFRLLGRFRARSVSQSLRRCGHP